MTESPTKKLHRSNQKQLTFGLDRLAFALLERAEKKVTVSTEGEKQEAPLHERLDILEGVGKYLAIRTRLPETEHEDDIGLADYRRAIAGAAPGAAEQPKHTGRTGSIAAKSAALRGAPPVTGGPSLADFKSRAAIFARGSRSALDSRAASGSQGAAAAGAAAVRLPDVPDPAKPGSPKPPDDEQF